MKFEVEQATMIAWDLPVVVARRLGPGAVEVGETSTLGGCSVLQVTELEPSLRADGTPRPALYAFALLFEKDLAQFAPGQVVTLSGGSEPASLR